MLCIRRTLAEGRATGFVSGLGAATADAIYGSIAAFGLTVVSGMLIGQQVWLRLIGGAFLCYLGLKTFTARPAEQTAAAIFAGLGFAGTSADFTSAAVLVAGVFLGSAAWWLILRARVTPGGLRWVNRISGGIILLFGVAALLSLGRLLIVPALGRVIVGAALSSGPTRPINLAA